MEFLLFIIGDEEFEERFIPSSLMKRYLLDIILKGRQGIYVRL